MTLKSFFERFKVLIVLLALALVVCGCDQQTPTPKVATPTATPTSTPIPYCTGVQCDGKLAGAQCPMIFLEGSTNSDTIYRSDQGPLNADTEIGSAQMRYSSDCKAVDAIIAINKKGGTLYYTLLIERYHLGGTSGKSESTFKASTEGEIHGSGTVTTHMVGVIATSLEETSKKGYYIEEIVFTVRASPHGAAESQTIVNYAA